MTDFHKLFKNKKILIWGLGLHGGGLGAAQFFAKHGALVTVTDLRDKKTLKPVLAKLLRYKNISYVLGKHRNQDFKNADLIIRNPAIRENNPYLVVARENKVAIENDIGLFLTHSPAYTIGITGSKGKSTLTQMTYDLLSSVVKSGGAKRLKHYDKVFLAGNIRKSVFDVLEEAKENSIVVLELSSFQLEHAAYARKSPNVAIITNIYNEHTEYHGGHSQYRKAKANILKFQKSGDYAIIAKSLKGFARKTKAKVIFFDSTARDGLEKLATIFGIPKSKAEATIKEFKGLEGRQEIVAKKGGVTYINDTTATHPVATIFALEKYKNPILIAGGVDKGFGKEIGDLASVLKKKKIRTILLPGDFSDILANKCGKTIDISRAESMKEAVITARSLAKKGDIVILSPGAASFNLFKNEFDRGEKFVEAIREKS